MADTPLVDLKLDLRRHCVETAIRQRYDAAIRIYFKQAQARPRLEEEIAVLLEALETLDFAALRSAHPALAGSTETPIRLLKTSTGQLALSIEGRPLKELPQCKTPRQP